MKMTKPRKIALGLSLAAITVGGGAFAADAAKGGGASTRVEVQAKAAERFARMDANKDGKLDAADHAARRAAMFDRIDTDRNGQISRAEFDAPRAGRGAQAGARDHDRDHRRGEGERGPGMRRHGDGHEGGRLGRGHGRGGMMAGAGADANKDGAVTQAEFTTAALQRFDRTDANRDGQVTREERQTARKAMREEMRARWQARATASPAPAN